MNQTIKNWEDPEGNKYFFKDEVARAQNRTMASKITEKSSECKTEIDVERKRIDKLITSQPAQPGKYKMGTLLAYGWDNEYDFFLDDEDLLEMRLSLFNQNNVYASDFVQASETQFTIEKSGLYCISFVLQYILNTNTDVYMKINENVYYEQVLNLVPTGSVTKTEIITFPVNLEARSIISFYMNRPDTSSVTTSNKVRISTFKLFSLDWEDKVEIPDYTELKTEVEDIRVGADGTIYDTAGGAVREQINEISQQFDIIGAPRNLFINLHTERTESGITTKVEGHKISVSGTATEDKTILFLSGDVSDLRLNKEKEYFVYGLPPGTFLKIQLSNKTIKDVSLENNSFVIPSDATLFAFAANVKKGDVLNHTDILEVYSQEYKGSFQEQIDALASEIEALKGKLESLN